MTLSQQGSPRLLPAIEKGMAILPLVLSSDSHVLRTADLDCGGCRRQSPD
jgi:hypothetical protein